jgi:hypothetical protein
VTKQEWLTSADPMAMLLHLRANERGRRITMRKLRLFAVSCCRRLLPLTGNPDCERVLELAEQFAEILPTDPDLERAVQTIRSMQVAGVPGEGVAAAIECTLGSSTCHEPPIILNQRFYRREYIAHAPFWCAEAAYQHAVYQDPPNAVRWHQARANEERAQADLLRCIVGKSFRPIACDPSWRTSIAVGLAEAIYADRAFDRLPILADALEEAGCTHPDVLSHCRSDSPHVRGCWVVDLVLGKA